MKNYKIIWSPSFLKEIDNIYSYLYYKLGNPIATKNFHKKIINKISSLSVFPERYVKLNSFKQSNLHRLQVDSFIIIYEIKYSLCQVHILHIFHGSQNYFNLL